MMRTGGTILVVASKAHDEWLTRAMPAGSSPGPTAARIETLADAWRELARQEVGCLIVDLDVLGADGLPLLERIVAENPNLPIVVLTDGEGDTMALAGLEHGAVDYVLTDGLDPDALERHIRFAVERSLLQIELQQAGIRRRATLEALQEGVVVQDRDGRILDANGAASDILRVPIEGLLTDPPNIPIFTARHADGRPFPAEERPGRMALITGERQTGVVIGISRAGGDDVWIEVNATPIRTADNLPPDSVLVAFRDITERRNTEAAMQFQAHLLNAAGQAIIATDPAGHIVYWNQAAEQLYGWSADEVIGRPIIEVTPTEETAEQANRIMQELAAGRTWTGDFWVRRRDGSRFPALVSDTPVFDDNGQLLAVIGVSTDISDRHRAEESSALLSAIVESSSDAIIGKTLDGIITSWNKAAEELYGYRADEAIGSHISFLAPFDKKDEIAELLVRIRRGERVQHFETERRRKDGEPVLVSLTVSAVHNRDGQVVGASAIAHDITEQTRLAQAAEENHRRLAEAQRIAQQRDVERQLAERANRAKSEFLSRMSHELRTPLNAVLGFGQLLQHSDRYGEDSESVDQILRAGRHLLDLINEVLEIARIETGNLNVALEPVVIDEVVRGGLDLMRAGADERGISVSVSINHDPNLTVLADRQRTLQVVLNLFSNAVKYNRLAGHIRVTSELMDENRLRVSVSDTGPGIPESQLARLFIPFDRLGAEHTEVEGTGIGLTLARGLIEGMGGDLGLVSTPDGSTFWFELALAQAPAESRAGASALYDRPSPREVVVLYIENEFANLRLVERIFALRHNVTLISAMQGRLGLELARKHRPHIVLLDGHLPDVDEAHVLHELRRDPATADTTVVVLSAEGATPQLSRTQEQAGSNHLIKPFDVDELLALVDRVHDDGPRVLAERVSAT